MCHHLSSQQHNFCTCFLFSPPPRGFKSTLNSEPQLDKRYFMFVLVSDLLCFEVAEGGLFVRTLSRAPYGSARVKSLLRLESIWESKFAKVLSGAPRGSGSIRPSSAGELQGQP